MISAKIKWATGLAAVALAGGLAATGTVAANASTDKCAQNCSTLVTQKFGDSFGLLAHSGNTVSLGADANNPGADWGGQFQGPTVALYAAHLISKATYTAWPNGFVYEFQWAPNGQLQLGDNWCLGVTQAGGSSLNVQACGATAKTLWIVNPSQISGSFAALISATTANTNDPGVLTATHATGPLTVAPLSVNGSGVIAPTQMWQSIYGVLH